MGFYFIFHDPLFSLPEWAFNNCVWERRSNVIYWVCVSVVLTLPSYKLHVLTFRYNYLSTSLPCQLFLCGMSNQVFSNQLITLSRLCLLTLPLIPCFSKAWIITSLQSPLTVIFKVLLMMLLATRLVFMLGTTLPHITLRMGFAWPPGKHVVQSQCSACCFRSHPVSTMLTAFFQRQLLRPSLKYERFIMGHTC